MSIVTPDTVYTLGVGDLVVSKAVISKNKPDLEPPFLQSPIRAVFLTNAVAFHYYYAWQMLAFLVPTLTDVDENNRSKSSLLLLI